MDIARLLTGLLTMALLAALPRAADAQSPATETILFVRHGEKPAAGLGQLDCRGLNRALALPAVLAAYGTIDAIFAPDPSHRMKDKGQLYDYVRPLATIEPTAIRLGLPVDTSLAATDVEGLRTALERPALRAARIVVAWEHTEIVAVARALVAAHGGDPAKVPAWDENDFDSIYRVTFVRSGNDATVSFEIGHEGLNGQSATCPG